MLFVIKILLNIGCIMWVKVFSIEFLMIIKISVNSRKLRCLCRKLC